MATPKPLLRMTLDSLNLLFFKNYDEASLTLSPHINCFIGENGSGKTNLLDAIHYLSMTKSAFAASDAQCLKQGADFFVVKGRFTLPAPATPDLIQCSLRTGQKKLVTHNKQPYDRLSDHIGRYPVVLISPYDTDLIRQGSEERRKYFDSLISQLDHSYLELLIQYSFSLKQRNALLKQFAERHTFDRDYLGVLDEQLVTTGSQIVELRRRFLLEFVPVFQRHYLELADSREAVTLEYKTQLLDQDFGQLLRQQERKDIALQRTTVGPHKDDYVFLMDETAVKAFGSQGQQKSYAIALKLAQFEIMASSKQHKPLLLLDDIFDRLDERRIKRLLQLVANHTFGQVFLTDTHLERTDQALSGLSEQVARFRVENGSVRPL